MGVGPENMALASAVVARSDDAYASFWNPAGLSELDGTHIALAKQWDSELQPINFFGIASSSSLLQGVGLRSTFAFAFIPRLHIKASGHYREDEFESIFTRYALPGLPAEFDGNIESKTKDYRFALGMSALENPRWRFGMGISYIECATSFCGVFAEDPGNYTIASGNATAWAVHLGGKYHYSDDLTLAISLKDVNTELDIEVVRTDSSGTSHNTYTTRLPRDLTIAVAMNSRPNGKISSDLQYIFGKYGNYSVDFLIWRTGLEIVKGDWHYRGGIMAPLIMESDGIEDIDLPFPFAPTAGVGWKMGGFSADAVLYIHPLISYQRNKPYPAMDFSLSYHF